MTAIAVDTQSRARRRVGVALITLVGLILVASSITKLAGVPPVVRQLDGFGFAGEVRLLGIMELASGALLLIPRTRSLGLLLASAFMGGAIATHLQHQELPAQPAIVLTLGWLGIWLRHPVALWSF